MGVRINFPFLFYLILLHSSFSRAYSFIDNRGLFPVGEKEMFMANTGIALSESSGSIYYNPAGLATITATKLSLSSNTYLSSKTQYSSLLKLEDQNFAFSTSGTQSIPSSLVSAWKGDRVNFAFGIFVPHQQKYQDSVLFSTPSYQAVQISRNESHQLLMAGVSLAGHLTNTLSTGLGCFYTTNQTSLQFDLALNPIANSTLKPIVSNSFFNAEVSGAICNVGIQHSINESVTWGLTVKSPLISIYKSGISARFVQTAQGDIITEGPKDADVQLEIPGEIAIGIRLDVSDRLKLYSDLNYQLPASYKNGNISSTSKFEHVGTLRYSGGIQFKISNKNDVLAGFSYNPSSLKDTKAEAQENFYVGSFGLQTQTENSVFGVGVFIAQSYGKMETAKYSALFQDQGTFDSDVKTSISGLLLSSGFSF